MGRALRGCAGGLGLVCLASIAVTDDGIALDIGKQQDPSRPVLQWTGKQPLFEIYRSTDPLAIIAPARRVATVAETQWVDTGVLSQLEFYQVASMPSVLSDLLAAATEVAGSMETLRSLDESILYGGQFINSAQFLHLASRAILAQTSPDPFPPHDPPPSLVPPSSPYPGIDLPDGFYNRPFTREEYIAAFRQLDDEYIATAEYPAVLTVDGAGVRYPELVYYAAGILRARNMLGYLPELWSKQVIAPEGLVPWSTPAGFEDYTSALEQYDGTPFFPDHSRRYYGSSAHEYEMLVLLRDILGNSQNAYQAGEKIYDWTLDQWLGVVGYTSGRTQFGADRSGWEAENFFYHTSGGPRRINCHLFRVAGIPCSIAGAAYLPNKGWFNIDSHRPYGTDPLDNPFYYDSVPPETKNMPHPSIGDDFVLRINAIGVESPTPPAPGERRSVYVNPRDVLDYGAGWVVDRAGDFDVLVLTVKSLKGYLYFGSTGWAAREQADALGPLILEAHARGKKVYAAVSTLGDRLTADEQPGWMQKLNEDASGVYPNLNVSPCVQAYRDQLTSLLHNLVTNYDVDGVVLDYLFFANVFGTEDTVGHPDCPTGDDWMSGVLDAYAATLVDAIAAADSHVRTVISSFPLGPENRYNGLDAVDLGHQDLQSLAQVSDEVMLVFLGTYWVPKLPPYWQGAIPAYRALTGRDPWVSFALVDEWEYTPRFYRGLVHSARQSGIAGFNLHTILSTLGEHSPALTRTSWHKVESIDVAD